MNKRRPGAPGERPTDGQKPQKRDEAIPKKVERVGLKRLRPRPETPGNFDEAIPHVEEDNDP